MLRIETEEPKEKRMEIYENISKANGLEVDVLVIKAKSTAIKSLLIKIEQSVENMAKEVDNETNDSTIALSKESEIVKQMIDEIVEHNQQISLRKGINGPEHPKNNAFQQIKDLFKKFESNSKLFKHLNTIIDNYRPFVVTSSDNTESVTAHEALPTPTTAASSEPNPSNFTIPLNKLPDGLPEELVNNVNDMIAVCISLKLKFEPNPQFLR